MRPFIVDDTVKQVIAELVQYAEKNPFSMDDVLDVYNNDMKAPGDMKEYSRVLPFGYHIVYSIEL